MGKIIGIDLGTTNCVVAIMEGKEPKVIVERGGRSRSRRRSSPGTTRARSSSVRSPSARRSPTREHRLLGQALHGPPLRRGQRRDQARAVQGGRARRTATPRSRSAARRYRRPRSSAHVLHEAQEGRRGLPRREGHRGGHHRPGVLQRRPAPGHQGRRPDRRPRRQAHRQRADRGRARLRPRQEEGRDHRRLRLRRRHLRHLDPRGRRQRRRGHRRPTATRTSAATTSTTCVMDWLVAEFKKDQGIDVSKDKMVLQRLQGGGGEGEDRAVDACRRRRSTCRSSPPTRPARSTCRSSSSRAKLEQMIERPRPAHDRAVQEGARRTRTRSRRTSHEVVLVGGSTRIPMVQKPVKKFFGKEPHKGVNPDEVVAIGAAVQAGVLSGDVKDMVLLDVTPLSLGIETLGGVMTVADPAQHHHPDAEERDVLDRGRQPDLGRGPRAPGRARRWRATTARSASSTSTGIPPAPRGVPQIEVTFDIDANGILNVVARRTRRPARSSRSPSPRRRACRRPRSRRW